MSIGTISPVLIGTEPHGSQSPGMGVCVPFGIEQDRSAECGLEHAVAELAREAHERQARESR